MLVYATHTGAKGITGRMDDILTRHGSGRSASRPPRDASATPGRSSWCDVLPEHPSGRRVEAGG